MKTGPILYECYYHNEIVSQLLNGDVERNFCSVCFKHVWFVFAIGCFNGLFVFPGNVCFVRSTYDVGWAQKESWGLFYTSKVCERQRESLMYTFVYRVICVVLCLDNCFMCGILRDIGGSNSS